MLSGHGLILPAVSAPAYVQRAYSQGAAEQNMWPIGRPAFHSPNFLMFF